MELKELLLAREQRAEHQRELLEHYSLPLVCLTMNIPGPEKNNDLITEAFLLGEQRLKAQFPPPVYEEHRLLPTGCEGYYVFPRPAEDVKALCMELEAQGPLGRLLDLDVLTAHGEKLSRPVPRPCLLCGEDARICRRRGSHPIEALAQRATDLLQEAVDEDLGERVSALAVRSLLYELLTTPKPGLVDQNNSGSHKDMDTFTFAASAAALGSYFRKCVAEGSRSRHLSPPELLPPLRFLGREAEAVMYRATGGVNTHKGAIFSLGLLCAAAGRLGAIAPPSALCEEADRHPGILPSPRALCEEASAIVKGLTSRELEPLTKDTAATKGEHLYLSHGLTGARGQAEDGFPAVLTIGLPVLEAGLERGLSLHRAGAAALLSMLATEPDTALISRSTPERYEALTLRLRELLGKNPYPTLRELEELDRSFIAENLSPGGSADLLALCYFLSGSAKETALLSPRKNP